LDVQRWAFLLRPAQRGYGETSERLLANAFGVGRFLFCFRLTNTALFTQSSPSSEPTMHQRAGAVMGPLKNKRRKKNAR